MDWDDITPKKPKREMVVGEPLASLSIGELEARIAALKAEISRVEEEMASKRRHEAAAASLFKR